MSIRKNALNEWLKQIHYDKSYQLIPLAGDASFRRYFRLMINTQSYVVMDAPPEKEGLTSFIQIAHTLREHGVHTPKIIEANTHDGFLILEDLGDQLLGSGLNSTNQDARYHAALNTLIQIQQCPTRKPLLPKFDPAHMVQEMSLFNSWFLEYLLGVSLTSREEKHLKTIFLELTSHLTEQPQCFIHRDYHSRNLLIVPSTETIGVIDFQDAMEGPFTYDLVSLIKDCYQFWPEETKTAWIQYFYQRMPDTFGWSIYEFQQGVDWCGLQRHLKVLGIFSRLHLRDHKSTYLKDLPLTLNYTLTCCAKYEPFHALYELIEKRVLPAFTEKQPA